MGSCYMTKRGDGNKYGEQVLLTKVHDDRYLEEIGMSN